jgi:nicotinate-nucleotide pyrophosphorylase (carboxylating)
MSPTHAIDYADVAHKVKEALQEDIGSGDRTALLIPEQRSMQADIISRQGMVVCGTEWVSRVFKALDADIVLDWFVEDGQVLECETTLLTLRGNARAMLTAERTALNFLQTLSATATQTQQLVQRIKGTRCTILDTRKTLPGMRIAQKYAVLCGGGMNHRMGLFDAFLIKENHIKACGSIHAAVDIARETHPDCLLEIEVENKTELAQALEAGPDRIMLDNFSLASMKQAVQLTKPYGTPLEASGNVSLENVREIAETGVDFISVGAITKSIHAIDLSMLVRQESICL